MPRTKNKKKQMTNLSVRQKLELIEKLESGASVSRVCEECGYLDLRDRHLAVSDTPSRQLVR
jgi:hypothetical protein